MMIGIVPFHHKAYEIKLLRVLDENRILELLNGILNGVNIITGKKINISEILFALIMVLADCRLLVVLDDPHLY